MSQRLNYAAAAPEVRDIMLDFWRKVENLGLDHKLLHLVYLRASQINGCAFCIDMHAKDMRASGESEQKVYMTSAWREAGPIYSEKERAAHLITPKLLFDFASRLFAECRVEGLPPSRIQQRWTAGIVVTPIPQALGTCLPVTARDFPYPVHRVAGHGRDGRSPVATTQQPDDLPVAARHRITGRAIPLLELSNR